MTAQLYNVDGSTLSLYAETRLREIHQTLGPVQLIRDTAYELMLTPSGKPGTSVLHEQYYLTHPIACFVVSPAAPVIGQTVTVDASCSSDVDNNVVSYAWDFGDGSAGTGVTATHSYASSASYTVRLTVTDALGDSGSISHSLFVSPGRTSLTGPFSERATDPDGDGLYDFIVARFGLYVAEAGTFTLSGSLSSSPTGPFVDSTTATSLTQGPQTIEVTFDGTQIYAFQLDGPYTIHGDLFAGGTLLDSASFSTSTYRHTDFEHPEVPPPISGELVPPHSDYGFDADGDGRFNFMVIDVRVQVTQSVSYHLIARMDALSMVADFYPFIQAGDPQTVPVYFDGVAIRNSGIDGPYSVSIELQDYYGVPLDSGTYETAGYLHTDFDTPPGAMVPPFTIEALDTDTEGAINWLITTVQVDVYETGFYEVEGALRHPETGTQIATSGGGQFLDPGSYPFTLYFDGTQIFRSGLDGPYAVDVELWDGIQYQPIGQVSQLTEPYRYTDFDSPSALLVPPHSDVGEDSDGDGLYNFINLTVRLEVFEPSTFLVSALASFGGGITGDSAETSLGVGVHEIALHLDGVLFYQTGVDGPYPVSLSVWDLLTGAFVDEDTDWTSGYLRASFDPPGASLADGHTAVPVDSDANGLFEFLEVRVSVQVDAAGWYTVASGLISADSEFQRYINVQVYLEAGQQVVSLFFPGYEIRSSGKVGPFFVSVSLSDFFPDTRIWGAGLGDASFTTQDLSYLQFE